MAKQPTAADISLPNIQGARPVASYDLSPLATGMAAQTRGFQALGQDIAGGAEKIVDVQMQRERQQAVLAVDSAIGESYQLRQKYQHDTDWATLPDRWRADLDAITEKHLGSIPEGQLRDFARAQIQKPFGHEAAQIGEIAFKNQANEYRAGLKDEADQLVNTAGGLDDPLRSAKIRNWGLKVQLGKEQGFFTPVEAEQLQRTVGRGTIDADFRARFRQGPQETSRAVADLTLAQAGIVAPTVDAWRTAGMPDHGIAGVLHNIQAESGFNPLLRHPDQPRFAPNDERHYAHGLYQEGAEEWQRYEGWINQNHPGADWRNPTLQSQFAAWNLKTNYPQVWGQMVNARSPEQAAVAYASGYLRPSAPNLRSRIVGINNNGVAPIESYGESSANPAFDILTPTHRDALIREGQTILRGYNTDYERQAREEVQARKDASTQEQLKIFGDIHTGRAPVTTIGILDNPNLIPEHKEKLVDLLERHNKTAGVEDHDVKTYGKGFYDAFSAVHAGEGDPRRITDPSQLYSRLGQDLTMAGIDKLSREIEGKRTPEGEAEGEMKRQFLKNARSQITGTDEGMHLKDPKGDELYLKFMADALPAYDKARKEGKTAAQLLNPDSPDYIGKSITRFRRPMEQWFADMVHDSAPGTAAAGTSAKFDINAVKSVSELQSAYTAGQITRDQAVQTAIDHGWAVRRAPVAPPPEIHVPLSQ